MNRHWERTRLFLLVFFFAPFLVLLGSYCYWLFIDLQIASDYGNYCRLTLTPLAVFFLLIEVKQLSFRGWRYFLDFWNYVETLPMLCVIFSVNRVGAEYPTTF